MITARYPAFAFSESRVMRAGDGTVSEIFR